MRWLWIDKFTVFESARRAVAVKNVTLAEEHLHHLFPAFPIMPASLIIEGMAQTAGILVGEARNFEEKVILAKIKRARFAGYARPGDQLEYEATIEHIDESAAATSGIVRRNGKPFGNVDIVFSHIDRNLRGLKFPEHNFVFTPEFRRLLATYQSDLAEPQPQGGGHADQ